MSKDKSDKDWVKLASGAGKIARLEAYFSGHGYEPHRHDTYAIGRTMSGVQRFNYRGSQQHSLPGGTMVLHPDEIHDGEAGTRDGFQYRMLYIAPALIQSVLGGKPLPFIPGGISSDPRLFAATHSLLKAVDEPIEVLEEEDALYELARILAVIGGQRFRRRIIDYPSTERAREYIHAEFNNAITLDELSAVSGRDRWSLSRDFRALYGTSPYRYVTMRRLEYCRRLILTGSTLTEAALEAGFSDQSHMTRLFLKTLGISPGRWQRISLK